MNKQILQRDRQTDYIWKKMSNKASPKNSSMQMDGAKSSKAK